MGDKYGRYFSLIRSGTARENILFAIERIYLKALSWWSIAVAVLLGVATTVVSPALHGTNVWVVDRVVMLMRHGLRSPKATIPTTVAPDQWPSWDVPPGWLTGHGAAAIRLLGVADAQWLAHEGVLPAVGCPPLGAVELVSNSEQRTIATGDAYLGALAPNCPIENHHQSAGVRDPLFDEYADAGVNPATARQAIIEALGPDGLAGRERRAQPALALLTQIACGNRTTNCGLQQPSDIRVDPSGQTAPELTGGLGDGSALAHALVLEYGGGKPPSEVGWGRADANDIEIVDAVHILVYAITMRPRVLAAANSGKLAQKMLDLLQGGPKLGVLVGHDTQITNIAGLLDLHWSIPGVAEDDAVPGGALGFQLLHDATGARFVRAFYRAQTLDDMRLLSPRPPVQISLIIPSCDGRTLCPAAKFAALLTGAISG